MRNQFLPRLLRPVRFLLAAVVVVGIVGIVFAGSARQAAASTEDDGVGFVVVVNPANSVSRLTAAEVSKIFMKRSDTWRNGQPVQPVDLKASSAVRARFSNLIHGKATGPIVRYWQQQIFSGQGMPPPEKSSEAEILDYVRRNRNAVGYVSTKVDLGEGVKVVRVAGL